MTEAEWLTASDATPMLHHLTAQAGGAVVCRKVRLFYCAAARDLWPLLTDDRSRNAVEVAERYADGHVTPGVIKRAAGRALAAARAAVRVPDVDAAWTACNAAEDDVVMARGTWPLDMAPKQMWTTRKKAGVRDVHFAATKPRQAEFLRDVFGNPFRPVTFSPSWLTPTVIGLSEGIYEDRAFDRLPILADTLQDAGCEDEAILGHCRCDGVHVRGCWVVDGVLGKG